MASGVNRSGVFGACAWPHRTATPIAPTPPDRQLTPPFSQVCVCNSEGAVQSLKDFKGNSSKCSTLASRILNLKGPLQSDF